MANRITQVKRVGMSYQLTIQKGSNGVAAATIVVPNATLFAFTASQSSFGKTTTTLQQFINVAAPTDEFLTQQCTMRITSSNRALFVLRADDYFVILASMQHKHETAKSLADLRDGSILRSKAPAWLTADLWPFAYSSFSGALKQVMTEMYMVRDPPNKTVVSQCHSAYVRTVVPETGALLQFLQPEEVATYITATGAAMPPAPPPLPVASSGTAAAATITDGTATATSTTTVSVVPAETPVKAAKPAKIAIRSVTKKPKKQSIATQREANIIVAVGEEAAPNAAAARRAKPKKRARKNQVSDEPPASFVINDAEMQRMFGRAPSTSLTFKLMLTDGEVNRYLSIINDEERASNNILVERLGAGYTVSFPGT